MGILSTGAGGSSSSSSASNKRNASNTKSSSESAAVVIDWGKVKVLLNKMESTFKSNPATPHHAQYHPHHSHSTSNIMNPSPSVGALAGNGNNASAASSTATQINSNANTAATSSTSNAASANANASSNALGSNTVHYLLLRTDTTTPLITSSNWNDLDLNQTDSQYIFAKLQLAARQLAATLQNSSGTSSASASASASTSGSSTLKHHALDATTAGSSGHESIMSHTPYAQAIHMRGQRHVFSYYALGEYSLILHREELAPIGLTSMDASSLSASTIDMDWAPAASNSSSVGSTSPDMICNDGSVDFDKEAVLKSILQQLYVSLNGYPESIPSTLDTAV
eukprot:TRINITY_DN5680_c0_g1_i1.p1 TRINITY_DN5680_c0_g1~~TRINITY_DN5680_c0_g1_i1.p1  ORF type:complete len:340 (-),score=54.81 TRINITY_DN5680_c0_g1_i1:329-1348(-)